MRFIRGAHVIVRDVYTLTKISYARTEGLNFSFIIFKLYFYSSFGQSSFYRLIASISIPYKAGGERCTVIYGTLIMTGLDAEF
jgi:hypothetical protein